ncbi:MAG: response regulator transcription factor [Cellvibrionaceae bacterium]
MKIALLEDDSAQSDLVCLWLGEKKHDVHAFPTGAELLSALAKDSFDLMIFDWHLPDTTGIEVLEVVRQQYDKNIPILFTTQRDDENDIVSALQNGADDYLIKPLRQGELSARVAALGRRSALPADDEIVEVGTIRLNRGSGEATVDGKPVKLTDKEHQLACLLLQHEGRLFSREYLLSLIWGISAAINTRTVDSHISKVRRILKINPEMGYRIKTIYQHGYRFEKI